MTGPLVPPGGEDELREALAAEAARHGILIGVDQRFVLCTCGWRDHDEANLSRPLGKWKLHVADALLRVVLADRERHARGYWRPCCGSWGDHAKTCPAARPAADVIREPTGGQELREALRGRIAEAICDSDQLPEVDYWDQADAVLALPEVAALIADGERVRRVRELTETWDSSHDWTDAAYHLRRALDGEDR